MLKRIQAGGVELAVEDRGNGAPVLFAHGFPLEHSMWDEQFAALASRHRVIAPDLRGFGQSQVVPGTSTMGQLADDLAALLDALGILEPVAFCGLSMGGYVAWQFWRRHRQRMAKLILCDTRAAADTPEAAQGRHDTAAKLLSEGPQVVWKAMRTKLFGPKTFEQRPEIIDRFEQIVQRMSPEGLAAALRGMAARPDSTDLLATIDVPTLVIVGEDDAISSPAEMKKIAEGIAGARLVVVPEAGHMAPVENPSAVNQALADFL